MTNNERAFLDMIAVSEGTAGIGDNGYNVLFGATKKHPLLFLNYDDHPRIRTYEKNDEFIRNGKKDFTTAAGRFQITASTFDSLKKVLGLRDFSPASQDSIALRLMQERGALDFINSGHFDEAVTKCHHIWASLTGAGYGQRENKIADLRKAFTDAGGILT